MPCDNDNDDDVIEKLVVSVDLGYLFTLSGSDDLVMDSKQKYSSKLRCAYICLQFVFT